MPVIKVQQAQIYSGKFAHAKWPLIWITEHCSFHFRQEKVLEKK